MQFLPFVSFNLFPTLFLLCLTSNLCYNFPVFKLLDTCPYLSFHAFLSTDAWRGSACFDKVFSYFYEKISEFFQIFSDVFRKISDVFWKISDVFAVISDVLFFFLPTLFVQFVFNCLASCPTDWLAKKDKMYRGGNSSPFFGYRSLKRMLNARILSSPRARIQRF